MFELRNALDIGNIFLHLRQKIRHRVKATARKWIHQNMSIGWRAWITFLYDSRAAVKYMQLNDEEKRRQVVVRRVAMRMEIKDSIADIFSWSDYWHKMRHQKTIINRMLSRWRNQKKNATFRTWQANVQQQKQIENC